MSTWTASDHPRGDGGRFKAKTHTEPEAELEPEIKSTPTRRRDGVVEWRTARRVLHRVGGPAVIRPGPKFEEWYQHGKLHREDGPAIIDYYGSQYWFLNGKRHRTDGPAVVHHDGTLQWYEHGVRKPPEVEAMLTMMWRARTPEGA